MLSKLSIAAALAALMSVALVSCDSGSSGNSNHAVLDRVRSERLIRVGYIPFPPTVIKDPATSRLSGHFVDAITAIAADAGLKVQFVETDWASFPAGLDSGRFDVSIAPTFATIPRALSVNFTRPLFYAGNSAIVRANDRRFRDISSLDQPGVRVAVTAGEAGHEYAVRHFSKAQIIVHSGSDETLTFADVLSGRADVALGDAYITSRFAAAHAGAVRDLFADHPYNLTPVCWAVASGQTNLLLFLNASIETLDSQGKLVEFERRYGAHWLHLKRVYEADQAK